jgi:hypothetical protein
MTAPLAPARTDHTPQPPVHGAVISGLGLSIRAGSDG